MTPHLLEVNAQPSVYNELLDQAVNEPMVQEMFRVVGYHIPKDVAIEENLKPFCELFNVTSKQVKTMLFKHKLYTKTLNDKDNEKQSIFNKKRTREDWLEHITDEFTPADIRTVIKYEEEVAACEEFDRIFPTNETHKYFPYFKTVSYYDKLLDGVEHLSEKNDGDRTGVIKKVIYYYRGGEDTLSSGKELHQ